MDDLKMIRELRSPAATMPAAVEDSVRDRLRAMAAEPAPPERRPAARRTVLRVGLVGGLAVATAAGVTVVQTVGGSKSGVQLAGAAELGDRAARAAEAAPYQAPGPKQWVYSRFLSAGGYDMNTWWKGVDLGKKQETSEMWNRVDGKSSAYISMKGELRVIGESGDLAKKGSGGPAATMVGGGPLYNLGNYHTLPTDPDALLRRLQNSRYPNQVGETGPEDVFEMMSHILDDPSPPKLRAAVFRALPKLRGVRLRHDVADAAGRRGEAFAFVDGLGERVSIILEPRTYRYLGTRQEVARPREVTLDGGKKITTRPGTVLGWSARLDQKIVDHAGQRS
ncbi:MULTISPECIES: CU044_5270 family protein [Actinomadura]|uniref:CU044_5270 family protein n=2 Tax=Actinomadura yumaensis TaxID=111807 RepID=A0ABW2CK99_9ACTN|nr:CU044_5270 family protein [Actinomadura sp. J1-007]MWK40706.1 hypothetical protein [Actinomadura sp. J1-007]